MITITQLGHNFKFRDKQKGVPAIEEDWGIERVAAFMFLNEWYRLNNQKYMKGATYIRGAKQYELENFDVDTNKDIDKLMRVLTPYGGDPTDLKKNVSCIFFTEFNKAITLGEDLIKKYIRNAEKPVTIFGESVEPDKFLQRPTQEEYDHMIEEETKRQEEIMNSSLAGVGTGERIRVMFGTKNGAPQILLCEVIRQNDNWYWVNAFRDGSVVKKNQKIKKDGYRVVK